MRYWQLTLIVAIFLTAFTNSLFWSSVVSRLSGWNDALFLTALFVVLVLVTATLLSLVSFRWLLKPVFVLVLLTSAAAAYFMDAYTTMINQEMIVNVLETDFRESKEFLNFAFIFKFVLLGVIPAYLLYRIPVKYPETLFKSLWGRILSSGLFLGTAVLIILLLYQDFSSFGRNNRDLRHFINPENYIFSLKSTLFDSAKHRAIEAQPIGTDAVLKRDIAARGKPSLVVFVIGETVRSDHFSLNGHSKKTNPRLEKEVVLSFTEVSSCGTATATSLPCMFSHLTRSEYSTKKGLSFQRLPDVVQQAGVNTLWRENNTGCKGNCDRITTHQLSKSTDAKLCREGGCFDEILLKGLDEYVKETGGDQLIFLHQLGNHGPAYYKRYPEQFEQFKPVCKTNQLSNCTKPEISNAYDNAILYTDHLLAEVIQYLNSVSDKYDTAMVYVSDHGESLGENNLYLHGMPYLLAPKAQKHVPLVVWLSEGYRETYQVDWACLGEKITEPFSHDHLFSSVLGMLDIQTEIYRQELDIFASCRSGT